MSRRNMLLERCCVLAALTCASVLCACGSGKDIASDEAPVMTADGSGQGAPGAGHASAPGGAGASAVAGGDRPNAGDGGARSGSNGSPPTAGDAGGAEPSRADVDGGSQ